MIGLYVDDLPLACKELGRRFKVSDMVELKWLLGMRITRDRPNRTLTIDQSEYIGDILREFGMEACNTAGIPMDVGITYLAMRRHPHRLEWKGGRHMPASWASCCMSGVAPAPTSALPSASWGKCKSDHVRCT
mmetsp:Transcript_26594/g.68908  ORF Transcript_26594/g.68908 Transcript_26594/m.68908 type:complete len:133 (+) Transcript_26594:79-477(+)